MSKCVLFTPVAQVFEQGSEVVACNMVYDHEASKFYKLAVLLGSGQSLLLVPQSSAVSFLKEMHRKGYYSEGEFSEIEKWLGVYWSDMVDITIERVNHNMKMGGQKVVIPRVN